MKSTKKKGATQSKKKVKNNSKKVVSKAVKKTKKATKKSVAPKFKTEKFNVDSTHIDSNSLAQSGGERTFKPQVSDLEAAGSLGITRASSFEFRLPNSSIAQYPERGRDESRLMVLNKATGEITNRKFYDILDYFDEDDVMVVNNTKVFPAKMTAKKEKTRAKIDVFLQRELNPSKFLWDAIVEPARKIRVGNKLFFGSNEELVAEIVDNTTSRGRTLRFLWENDYEDFKKQIYRLGTLPLPAHINRKAEPLDNERYQTVFGKKEGAVVAPAAGLHFSEDVVKYFEVKGVCFAEITLHCGLSTYRPIDIEDLHKYKVDSEQYSIPPKTADMINKALLNKKRICAVGCSTFKTLESSYSSEFLLVPQDSWTNLYLFPPYTPKISNALLTNFHPPKTALFTAVCAFAGFDIIQEAYKKALAEKYKFCSYGDAMLII